MDWNNLVPHLIRFGAPLVGEALGGPFGAVAGKIVATAFGATEATPTATREAIENADPAAASAAARVAEDEWRAALANVGRAQVSEVGQTQRAEIASDDLLQRWWRPVYALELTLLECPGFAVIVGRAMWSGKAEIVNAIAALSGLLMTYMAARFGVLGVYVSGRSREKQAEVTGEAVPSLVAEIVKAMAKRK